MNVMKNLFLINLIIILFLGCTSGGASLDAPSDVTNVEAEPRVGGALITWDLPSDSNFLYLDIKFDKYPNETDRSEIVTRQASSFTDSLFVDGLLNRYEYTFSVQPFNAKPGEQIGGELLETQLIRPIRRPMEIVKHYVEIEGITADMIYTHTQEQSEGPKENLLDGNINTFWHSAWSAGVAPLPHWIQIDFNEATTVGAFSYTLRQGANASNHPNMFALEVSNDGIGWEEVWRSEPELPTTPADNEFRLEFGQNFEYTHYRVVIIATPAMGSFTYLSTLSLFEMIEEVTDLEEIAEENY